MPFAINVVFTYMYYVFLSHNTKQNVIEILTIYTHQENLKRALPGRYLYALEISQLHASFGHFISIKMSLNFNAVYSNLFLSESLCFVNALSQSETDLYFGIDVHMGA